MDVRNQISRSEIFDLQRRVKGPVVLPEDPGYDTARSVWNGMIDRYPAAVVRAVDTLDVAAVIRTAAETGAQLSVRGGGHNVAGYGTNDGGLVVDLSLMRRVEVDPASRIARAQGGATIADLDEATQQHALATPMGVISETGIAGLTLGGGYGWLRRRFGLSADNLISAELVTAAGEVVEVSDETDPELMWGLRGAGANFGVATRLDYQLHEVGPDVHFAGVMYPLEQAGHVIRGWRDFMENAPDDVSSQALIWSVPSADAFPPETHGTPVVILAALHSGDSAAGERELAPLREMGSPIIDLSGQYTYLQVQKLHDAFYPRGVQRYWKALELDGLDDHIIDKIVEYGSERPSQDTLIPIWHFGGAMSRVAAHATSFGDRSAPYLFSLDTSWENPVDNEQNVEWTRRVWSEMHEFSSGGFYVNFPGLGEEGIELSHAAYGSNYGRLTALKAKHDPNNLFRLNSNIEPKAE